MNKQRVLIVDIETAPILAFVWGLKDQNIGLNQIESDWYIMAWGAKWLDDPKSKLEYKDVRKHLGDDKPILKPLWELLNQADIVITQNGKKFDSRRINARFMLQGFNPPSPYRHFDTYLLAKNVADFTSHSLAYLTDKLNKSYKKLSHGKFPGMTLWRECLKGNTEAWEEMKKYNIHDVLSTEELYNTIKAWAPDNMPKVYEVTDLEKECSRCGYVGQMRIGKDRNTGVYKYRQNSCQKCGSWQKAERIK